MDQLWLEVAKSSPTAAVIGLVVWFSMRDQGRILRSIDLRMAKLLERTRDATPTYPLGVPIVRERRKRTHQDSDEPTNVPRTITDEDLDDDDDRKD